MKNQTAQTNLLVGLIAQTSIHAGAGSSAGAVDLPIQREGHNGWPCIFGSAVKGAMRTKAEQVLDVAENKEGQQLLTNVFGPDTQSAADHAGAISVGDARLLLLPVRSLTSAFKWVTCPAALDRFKRDAAMLGKSLNFDIPVILAKGGNETALCVKGDSLFLEEYHFSVDVSNNLDNIIKILSGVVGRDGFADALREQLAIISNDMFAHLARSATPVNAHIAIDSKTKTVTGGALWYEETLPPETVLYIPIMAQKSRNKGEVVESTAVAACVRNILTTHPWLQLGGNETVGMGWCAVNVETVWGL